MFHTISMQLVYINYIYIIKLFTNLSTGNQSKNYYYTLDKWHSHSFNINLQIWNSCLWQLDCAL